MKVLPFKIPKPASDTLIYQVDLETSFYDQLHQHAEIQLSLIVEGEGTLIVGDTINDYTKGDILIIGSNLPHVFKSDLNTGKTSHMLTLFFTRTAFGNHFFDLEELHELNTFFNRAAHGFKIISDKIALSTLFFELESASKLSRFIILLKLLKIASLASYKSLSSFMYNKTYSGNEGYRMRKVFEFTMNNFKKDISLDIISEIANMTKKAFCKYFKKRTNKTYFQFLTELRIEHASKLLLKHKEMPVIEIAELSGYNNLSNFNRQFKSLKHKSPSMFRKTN